MKYVVALAGSAAVALAFLAVGVVVGALILIAILGAVVVACLAVGVVIGDAVGSIGSGRRRAPRVSYWSAR